jgi:predicted ATPase
VLVGPNGSGKSTILDALSSEYSPTPEDQWKRLGGPCEINRKINGTWFPGPIRAMTYQKIHLDVARMRSQNQAGHADNLAGDGSNLTNLIASQTRKQQDEIARKLGALVPTFADVDVRPTSGGHQSLFFEDRWRKGLWFTPHQVSDGTMLTLGFIALTYQAAPPDLLAIEEPERGLHPFLLGEIVQMLRKLANGELGPKKMQIVAATHSAELLDHLEPSEVRFLRRNASDGSTDIIEAKADTPDWKNAYAEYQESLGSMWLSGGLGGVPSTTR